MDLKNLLKWILWTTLQIFLESSLAIWMVIWIFFFWLILRPPQTWNPNSVPVFCHIVSDGMVSPWASSHQIGGKWVYFWSSSYFLFFVMEIIVLNGMLVSPCGAYCLDYLACMKLQNWTPSPFISDGEITMYTPSVLCFPLI